MKRRLFFAVLCGCFGVPSLASAAGPEGVPDYYRLEGSGLIVHLPVQTTEALLRDVAVVSAQLRQRRAALADRLDAAKLSKTQQVAAFLLPGGLVYRLYKRGQRTQAKAGLEQVEAQLVDLAEDRAWLAAKRADRLLAQDGSAGR